jgi:flagellar protein FlgJ
MNALPAPAAIDKTSPLYTRLHKQATDLEGVFLNTLMKEMFSSIKTDAGDFGGGFGDETWRGMQAEQLANAMAQQGGIGLADHLMPTLLSMQEAQPPTPGV